MERNYNSYYDLAQEDWATIQDLSNSKRYNNIVVLCQQAVEKLLKSVAQYLLKEECYLRLHKLARINRLLLEGGVDLHLDDIDLYQLSDFYFDARYPGDSFVRATEEDVVRSIQCVKKVVSSVDEWRLTKGLPVYNIIDISEDSLLGIASKIQ